MSKTPQDQLPDNDDGAGRLVRQRQDAAQIKTGQRNRQSRRKASLAGGIHRRANKRIAW